VSATVSPSEVEQIAVRRVAQLRQLSFDEVSALPERLDESETVHDREVSVAVWRDILTDGRIRVVVQAYFHRILGIGTMAADGFIIATDGTRTPVPQEMLWEFT
jgi:hypothetical protein